MSRYRVRRAGRSITPAGGGLPWEEAVELTEFGFPWENRPAPETRFRALWDEELLRFRFECADSDLVLAPGADAREKVIGSDRVEIFFAPDLSLDPYFCFEADPRGEILDYEARFHRRMNWEWAFPGLEIRSKRTEDGYLVEGSVPLETLRNLGVLLPGARKFAAGVFRAEFSRLEDGSIHEGWISWIDPGTREPDFHVPSAFGVFELQGDSFT